MKKLEINKSLTISADLEKEYKTEITSFSPSLNITSVERKTFSRTRCLKKTELNE